MFHKIRLNIFIYYFVTVTAFLGLLYYFLRIVEIQNVYLVVVIILLFVSLSGIFISKLGIDPLCEYIQNLQNLSKETLHELNLPLSTIITNTQMLSKDVHDKKSLKRLERINNACIMLKDRYNELEYMIKTQSEENLNESFYVDELVKERVEFLKKIYPSFHFNLKLEVLQVINDKKGLSKTLDNLIDNGVKYSKNSKNIDIEISDSTLYVIDYGIGMDEVELLRIFDNYYQSNKGTQGFGIGLSMVKRFCDKNDVQLHFKSSPNNGSRVELKFKKIQGQE